MSKMQYLLPVVLTPRGHRASSKDEIIKGLNEDLAREYKAIIQYVVFSSTLKGAEYGDIAEQLKVHASEELAHALEVAKQIDYLGGDPTVNVQGAEYSQDSKNMFEIDLKQEQGNCRPSSVSNIVHRKVKKKRSNLKQIFILSRDDQAIVRHYKNASITIG